LEGARRATGNAPSVTRPPAGNRGPEAAVDGSQVRDAVESHCQGNRHDTGPNHQVHTDAVPHTVRGTGAGKVSTSRMPLSTAPWPDLGRPWKRRADSFSVPVAGLKCSFAAAATEAKFTALATARRRCGGSRSGRRGDVTNEAAAAASSMPNACALTGLAKRM
jgi:hypothetical protein